MTNFLNRWFGLRKNVKAQEMHPPPVSSSPELPQRTQQSDPLDASLNQLVDQQLEKTSQDEWKVDLSDYKHPDPFVVSEEMQRVILVLKDYKDQYAFPLLWSREGEEYGIRDLKELKNILITGTQATGKTAFIHQLIISLITCGHPSTLTLVLADAKGVELPIYSAIEKHFLARMADQKEPILKDGKNVVRTVNSINIEMDERYSLLQQEHLRSIEEFNEKHVGREWPYIVVIIDDLGSYVLEQGNEVKIPLYRILERGYRVGVYTILNIFQPDAEFLSRMNERVVFRLNSREQYRNYFDTVKMNIPTDTGEFLYNNHRLIIKGQTIPIAIADIESIVNHISRQPGYPSAFLLPQYRNEDEWEEEIRLQDRDPLFEEAARLIVQNQVGSTSLLQRRMKLGYNRTVRLMDQLQIAGIVGSNQGSKARDVLIRTETELDKLLLKFSD